MVTNRNANHNDEIRVFAPLRTNVYSKQYGAKNLITVTDRPAQGRIVIAGGNYQANPAKRLRLRVVYSKL